MTKKKKLFAAAIAALLLLAAAAMVWRYYTGPEYSLYRAWQACRNHDREEFDRYVDVDRLSESLVDGFTAQLIPGGRADSLLGNIARGFVGLLKPVAIGQLRQGIYHYVETGRWPETVPDAGHPIPATGKLSIVQLLPSDSQPADLSSVEYRSATSRKIDAHTAVVSVTLFVRPLGRDVTVDFRMYEQDWHFRLIGIDNVAGLTAMLKNGSGNHSR
ncbi:MAG: DUF2939 domain-containing protein [Negativicutes bacterium]|nr:DUF2939 domain-containing protein [Negativicutes bacterium]